MFRMTRRDHQETTLVEGEIKRERLPGGNLGELSAWGNQKCAVVHRLDAPA